MKVALVVDDNNDIRLLIKQALEMENFEIIEAENGLVAQQKLESGIKPDVILLDIMMPVMDGHQFLYWKTNTKELTDVPVIVISALTPSRQIPGAANYLRKPLDLKSMIETIEKACS